MIIINEVLNQLISMYVFKCFSYINDEISKHVLIIFFKSLFEV